MTATEDNLPRASEVHREEFSRAPIGRTTIGRRATVGDSPRTRPVVSFPVYV